MQSQSPSGQFAKLFALNVDVVSSPEHILRTNVCTIGRHRTCDVIIYQEIVSRLHVEIKREGPRYALYDKSTNGTFVNNCRINQTHLLRSGDAIGLGKATPLLRFYDPADDPTPIFSSEYNERLLYFHDPTMTFFLNEHPLNLTPKEFRLLHYLYQHAEEVCSRENCAQAVWGSDYDNFDRLANWSESLNRTIAKLRNKFRKISYCADNMLETRRTLGYRLNLDISIDS